MSQRTPPRQEQSGSQADQFGGLGPRRRSVRRLAVSIGVAAVLGVLAALLGLLAQPVATTPAVSALPTATPVPTVKPKVPDPAIGGSQTVDNIKITLLGIRYTYGSGTTRANVGNIYAVVMLRIENRQGVDYPFSPNVVCQLGNCNFYLRDNQGEKNPPVLYDPYYTHLRAVVLQPAGVQQGSYTFEVPEHDRMAHDLRLLYYPSPLFDANAVYHWNVTEASKHG